MSKVQLADQDIKDPVERLLKRNPAKLVGYILVVMGGVTLNLFSLKYEQSFRAMTGSGGPVPTFELLPKWGFPFQFVYDSPNGSVIGRFGPEDNFHGLPFLANQTLYCALLLLILRIARLARQAFG